MLVTGRTFDSGIAAPDPPPKCGVAAAASHPPMGCRPLLSPPVPPQAALAPAASTEGGSTPARADRIDLPSTHARTLRRPAAHRLRPAADGVACCGEGSPRGGRQRECAIVADRSAGRSRPNRDRAASGPRTAGALSRRSGRDRRLRQRRDRAVRRPRHGAAPAQEWRAREEDVRDLAVALIGLGGRHIDDATPCVDVRLEGGIRVHAVLPPVAAEGTAISIRVPAARHARPRGAAGAGHVRRRHASRARGRGRPAREPARHGRRRRGQDDAAGGAARLRSGRERIVTIEDVAELRHRCIPTTCGSRRGRRTSRAPARSGSPGWSARRCGCVPTGSSSASAGAKRCASCSPRSTPGTTGAPERCTRTASHDVPARLEALGALAGLDDRALARQVVSAIGCVLHVARRDDGVRMLVAAGRPVLGAGGRLGIEEVAWPAR